MGALLTWFLDTRAGRIVMASMAGLGALSVAGWRLFIAGRTMEKRKNNENALKGAGIRHEVEENVAASTADANRQRLCRWSRD